MFSNPVSSYSTIDQVGKLHSLAISTVDERLQVLDGSNRTEIFDSIPKDLSFFSQRIGPPNAIKYKACKYIAVLPLIFGLGFTACAVFLGLGGSPVDIAMSALVGGVSAFWVGLAIVSYVAFYIFEYKHKFDKLKPEEIKETKEKFIKKITKIIHKDIKALKNQFKDRKDLISLTPSEKNQITSIYLLSRFIQEPIEEESIINYLKENNFDL